jgi:DNA-binding protein HU-beta
VLLGDLIQGVATDTAQPKAMVKAIVRATLARIERAVGKRETVNLVGFGRFEVYERGARRGRNLRTGESLKIQPLPRCASGSASVFGMPLPDRHASRPRKVRRSSCHKRQLDARDRSDSAPRAHRCSPLGRGRLQTHSVGGDRWAIRSGSSPVGRPVPTQLSVGSRRLQP